MAYDIGYWRHAMIEEESSDDPELVASVANAHNRDPLSKVLDTIKRVHRGNTFRRPHAEPRKSNIA